jgi:hypothetical protein
VISHGASQLISSAAGTRMALLTIEPLATAHTTGSSRLGLHAGDLLGVEGEVVAEHAGGLLGGDLGHGGDVVQDGGDVVDQCEQGGSGQVSPRLPFRSRKLNAPRATCAALR